MRYLVLFLIYWQFIFFFCQGVGIYFKIHNGQTNDQYTEWNVMYQTKCLYLYITKRQVSKERPFICLTNIWHTIFLLWLDFEQRHSFFLSRIVFRNGLSNPFSTLILNVLSLHDHDIQIDGPIVLEIYNNCQSVLFRIEEIIVLLSFPPNLLTQSLLNYLHITILCYFSG